MKRRLEDAILPDDPQNESVSNYYEIIVEYKIYLRGIFKTIPEIEEEIRNEFDIYNIDFHGINDSVIITVTFLEDIPEYNFETCYEEKKNELETKLTDVLDEFLSE